MFKNLSVVVFMSMVGCASETVVNDQVTDSVTQTPTVTVTPETAVSTSDVTVSPASNVTTSTTCQDGSVVVDGVCPQTSGTSTTTVPQ